MAYKVLRGVHITDELFNSWEAKGYYLVDVEEHMGMYDVVLSDDPGGGGGGGSATIDGVDNSMELKNKILGVKLNNKDGNVVMEKTSEGITSNYYWKEYKTK